MTPSRYNRFRQALDRRQPDLTILTDQVHKPHNLSAILRTCDAVGIHEAHITQPKRTNRKDRRCSMGSHRWVEVHSHDTIEESASYLKKLGFKLFAAHFSSQSLPFLNMDFTQPCAIMLGAEKNGISSEGADLADEHIIIPMAGLVSSFNVSVAAAIILAEAQRQRTIKGLYDSCRMDNDVYQKTLFRWCYPELARYCNERSLDYPATDDNGHLISPAKWYNNIRQTT